MLTLRQKEILELVALGWSEQKIARRLFLAHATIKTILHCLRKAWDVHTTGALIFILRRENRLRIPIQSFIEGPLTEKETHIAPFVTAGQTNKQITENSRPPKYIISEMLYRYECSNRVHLATFLAQRGF